MEIHLLVILRSNEHVHCLKVKSETHGHLGFILTNLKALNISFYTGRNVNIKLIDVSTTLLILFVAILATLRFWQNSWIFFAGEKKSCFTWRRSFLKKRIYNQTENVACDLKWSLDNFIHALLNQMKEL
jgi:hypothetical protein